MKTFDDRLDYLERQQAWADKERIHDIEWRRENCNKNLREMILRSVTDESHIDVEKLRSDPTICKVIDALSELIDMEDLFDTDIYIQRRNLGLSADMTVDEAVRVLDVKHGGEGWRQIEFLEERQKEIDRKVGIINEEDLSSFI
jgi:hypothetical protein